MADRRRALIVEAVWGVDLIEAQVRSNLGLPPSLRPSRRPRCAVVDSLVYAPASGRLATLPFPAGGPSRQSALLDVDVHTEVGEDVVGPDAIFATSLAEVVVRGVTSPRRARSLRRCLPSAARDG